MIEIRLACGCVGLVIILNALFDVIEKRRNSYLYKSFSLKKSPVRFILMLLVDFVIGATICYRSYLGTYALGSTIALIFALNLFSLAFSFGISLIIKEEEDDDEQRSSGFIAFFFGAIVGAFIVYSAINTGVSFSDIGDFIAEVLDAL